MKPSQQLAALAVAGFCGAVFGLPQVPYYTSRFPQHPQNLGYGGDYPKYWQGEGYSAPQESASYYNPSIAAPSEPAPPAVEERPSFTDRRYPAREAIKYYGGSQFPVNEEEVDEADKNVQNVKIKNDNPTGDNDKTFTRITKSPGIGRKKKAPEVEEPKKSGGLESIADIATPKFDGAAEIAENKEKEEEESENWNSFTFGVVSDTLVYHDPYENREGDFERKTNAMEKIEKMMGHEYGKKDIKNRRSLNKRDWPEHIQEKALKMMDSASTMQTKGQKTIDNDPTYQESLRAKNPAPEPAAAQKSTFPVSPKSKGQQAPPPRQQPQQPQNQGPPPPPKKKAVGSGGGELVPPGKSGKLNRAKGQSPPPPPPQQQAPRPPSNQPPQKQPPRNLKAQKSPKGPKPLSDANQPRQPAHQQPNRQPSGDMSKRTGNSKQPQQGNFPSQNSPNQRPQNAQKKPQNGQKRAPQGKQPQQRPQNNLRKRQVPVPAGPNYPPGTTIIRRPYVAPQAASPVQKYQAQGYQNQGFQNSAPGIGQIGDGQLRNQGQVPGINQIPDGQIQRQFQQVVPIPAPAPIPVPVPVPAPVVIQQQAVPVPVPVQQVQYVQKAPVVEKTETVQFAAIVHPGQVICPENKPCPPPQPEYIEKTVLQPVQRLREVEVAREAVRAVPGFEAVDVVREVDVVKEKQVEKQVIREPYCDSCEQEKPKTITICAKCREAVDECSCYGSGRGDSESYSKTFSNGKEATAYGGPHSGFNGGPVSTPGGLEAFFRQRMPEHFEN